jgi:hypothetical protein
MLAHLTKLTTTIFAGAMLAGATGAQDQNSTTTLACLNAGVRYKVGEFACIAACHERRRLARCDAIAEKTSWTYVEESCPTAMINAPWPSDWSEVPVLTAMSPTPLVVNLTAIPPDDRIVFADFGEPKTITQ